MKNKRMKFLSILTLTMLVAGVVGSCASFPSQEKELPTITIAVVDDDPGTSTAPNPHSAYAGILSAAQQVSGVNVIVQPYADHGDADTAKQIAEKIVASSAVAVIGHSSIETSRAAGDVYDKAGIPVLNYMPVTESLMAEHPYYFNTTYTAESEAAYIANYLRKINGVKTASIIYTVDGYSQTIAKQFKNTFQGLGGKVTIEELVIEKNVDDVVSEIISANPETNDPGTIFIATDDKTAADLVVLMRQKGVSYPVAGASNLTNASFLDLISDQVEEKTFPGYYTNNILATRAVIFDSVNRYANQFRHDFQTQYQMEPGDRVVNGYDAALVLLAAIQRAGIMRELNDINRQDVYKSLISINNSTDSVQGVVNSIYFEPSRNIIRAARFGIYQNGQLVSANVQFEPIVASSTIKDLQEQVDKGRIMTVNGAYVYKANVVYAGVDILGIDEIDIKTSTYAVDFYLWFRYRPNAQDLEFQPDDFVFTNLESGDAPLLIREEQNSDGTVLKTYRVNGVFKNPFQFYDYPFDHQNLVVEFRNQNADTTFIQYVVDQVGMRYKKDEDLLANYSENGAFTDIYGWDERSAHVTQDIFPTYSTFGNPQAFDSKVATNYSLINVNVDIQRTSLQYIVKSLLPLLITLILAYITFFLPLGHSERLGVGSTALLTTAFFHLTLADALPQIGYTVAMEYLFYASYTMSALIVFLETLSIRYEHADQETEDEAKKKRYQSRRKILNLVGRVIYPSILFLVMAGGTFVYKGTLHLGPKEVDARNLVDMAMETNNLLVTDTASVQHQTAAGDEIKLRLITWRPEDEKQIQVLLDEFHKYAQETLNKNIVIEHKPVVSVNYDSILDIQLSGSDGPDLFYVRPFSVDGNIAKYLTPLNDMSAIDESYDPTKITPWRDRAGTYYAVPFAGVVQGVYYNKDLFDKYGVSVPTTWDEFLSNLAVIAEQDPSIIPIANALNAREDSEMFMSVAANFLGGPDGRARLMRKDGTGLCYDSAKVVSAFQAIADLKPYLPADAATIGSQRSKELFFNQQAVMLFGGSWDLKKVSDEAIFNWGVFAVPAPASQKTYVIFQPDIGIGINKSSVYQGEARAFLEWMMTKQAVDLTAKNLVGFYPLNKIKAKDAGNVTDQKFLDLVNKYPGDIRWMFVEISNKVPRADKIIIRDLYEIISSDLSPEDAAKNLQNGLGEWYVPAQNCIK